jgi:hypothetical protein
MLPGRGTNRHDPRLINGFGFKFIIPMPDHAGNDKRVSNDVSRQDARPN